MNRIKLSIVAIALAGFVGLLFSAPGFNLSAEAAQGKKGQKPKKGVKATPAPTASPTVISQPKVMPPPAPAPPSVSPSTPPAMVKPPTAATDTPGVTPPMVKPPTATTTPQAVKPLTAPDMMARKGPKPPDGNIIAIAGAKGKAVPYAGKEEPIEPLLFSTDNDARFVAKAAFDHTKHSREASYSVSGTAVSTCAECHHTDQAANTAGLASYYKLFERKELMTSKTLADGGQLVSSCRVCHRSSRESEAEGYPPEGVAYPDSESDKRNVYGDKPLNNEIAYHANCIVCHERAKKARPAYKFNFLPANKCTDCHFKAS